MADILQITSPGYYFVHPFPIDSILMFSDQEMHLLELNLLHLYSNFIEYSSYRSDWQIKAIKLQHSLKISPI